MGAASHASCLGPTEIVVELSTDVPCDVVTANGVAIAIGPPGNDTNETSASTHACTTSSNLGSLVIVPSGAGPTVGIRVTLGVNASIEECNAGNDFSGCIVARRSLDYDPHQPLMLPIALQSDCLTQPCDPTSTCYDGICVDAGVTCANGTCALRDAGAPSCTPFSVTPVPSGADPQTPHIVAVPGGWVISWVSNGILEAQALDAMGNAIGSPVPLGSLPNGSLPRAIGSDGTSVVAFSGNVQPDAGFVEVYAALLTADAGLSTGGVGVPPIAGVFPVDAGTYQALFGWMETITGQLRTVTADTVDPFIATYNGSAFSLARAGTTLYAVFDNYGTCVVSCMPSCQVPDFGVGTCGWIRFAPTADGGSWGAVYNDTTKGQDLFVVMDGGAPLPIPMPANYESAIPLATSSGVFAVYRSADLLYAITPGGATSALPTVLTSYYSASPFGGTGAGFDVAAADPTASPEWAAVYWSGGAQPAASGSIVFTHQCGP